MKTSRRIVLKTLGAFAALAPIANLLRTSIADAAPTVAPLRLVCISHGLHINDAFFHPRATAGAPASQVGSDTTFSVDFPASVLQPLLPYQDKLIVVRGLNYQGVPASHSTMLTVFTGAGSAAHYDNNACNDSCSMPAAYSSIEQYIASRMAPPSALSPLVIRVGYVAGQTDFVSYFQGQPASPQTDPSVVFKAYFGSSTAAAPDAGSGPSAETLLYNRRKALFGVTQADLQSLQSRLGPTERVKLDQHLSALDSLAQRLAPDGGPPQGAPVTCTPPTGADQKPSGSDVTDFENFVTLVAEAFACDLTRYASIQMFGQRGGFPTSLIPQWSASGENPHDCSHNSHGNLENTEAINLALWQNLFYTQIAKLLAALAAIDDPLAPGQKLLDNTMVVMAGEHGISPCIWNNNEYEQSVQHGFDDVPFVIAGGCAGRFTMGRIYAATPRQGTPDDHGLYTANLMNNVVYAGVPHNAALAAVVNAFEAQQAAFDPSYAPMPVTQYGLYGTKDGASPLSL
jgi:hypothetical protein